MKFWITIFALVGIFIALIAFNKPSGGDNTAKEESSPVVKLASMVGRPAPDFTLTGLDGKLFRLSDLRGKKVVLFFSEGIMCYPACWNQMAALGTDNELNSNEVTTASIVTDDKDSWIRAIQKMPDLGKGIVLLDSDQSISRQYDVLTLPSSMHKGSSPGHTYIVIDKDGVVRHVEDDPKMGIHNAKLKEELAKI